MKHALLLLLSLTCIWAADPEPKLPADAQRALDAFNAAEARIKAKADAEVAAERAKLVKALETAKVAATKAGRLEEALAVKAVQDKNTPADPLEPGKGKVTAGLPVGGSWILTWTRSDGSVGEKSITLNEDMTISGMDSYISRWKMQGSDLILLSDSGIVTNVLTQKGDGWAYKDGSENNWGGRKASLIRVK